MMQEKLFSDPFLNTGLFADHFLEEILPKEKLWKEILDDPTTRDIYDKIKQLYHKTKEGLPDMNEAQTEKEFIRPVLDLLGFADVVQTIARTQKGVLRPDYALYPDESAKKQSQKFIKDGNYQNVLAIAEAKYWDRPLDKVSPEDIGSASGKNPSMQVASYFLYTRVPWAILTNGKIWRLYSRDHSPTYSEFYQADLEEIIIRGGLSDFIRFYLFFRKEAFISEAEGKSFLDRLIDQSIRYGSELQDNLRKLIFDQVFPMLAKGFIKSKRDKNQDLPESSESLKDIYDNTLILLYRLLFILYAEARDLLPVKDKGYLSKSLSKLKYEIKKDVEENTALSPESTDYWDDLVNLFRLIDRGSPHFNLPRYNGGLFSKLYHSFLENEKVGDSFLVPALYYLTVDNKEKRPVFVDYKSLGVQQLGSIYEGLLEFHLSPEGLLTLDKSERKSSGSYYTPEFIVRYIVEKTIGPLVDEIEEKFEKKITELSSGSKYKGLNSKQKNAELKDLDPAQKVLSLKICDPAMGSGHFLVDAVDYLSEKVFDLLSRRSEQVYFKGEPYQSPLYTQIKKIRSGILTEMERQGVTIDQDKLDDDKVIIRRMVMKQCVFGVDLNPLAVELSKLSLWLRSFTVGAPLSFMDHHLRVGNSLIGEELDAVKEELHKDLFGSQFAGLAAATDAMIRVGSLTDSTISELEESRNEYKRAVDLLSPYKVLLDIWACRAFPGLGLSVERLIQDGRIDPDNLDKSIEKLDKKGKALYDAATSEASLFSPFHWKLEFPEVFFENGMRKHYPGFDAVIGNPPYVRGEGIKKIKPYLKTAFGEVYHGQADMYIYFYHRGHELLRGGGRFGMITSNKFMRSAYGSGLRDYLARNHAIREIVDFGELPVFPEAATFPVVVLTEAKADFGTVFFTQVKDLEEARRSLPELVERDQVILPVSGFQGYNWSLAGYEEQAVFDKMRGLGIPLGEYVGGVTRRGVLTGRNEAFIIDRETRDRLIAEDSKSGEIIKPLLIGDDIRRYEIQFQERYLIWTYVGVPIKKYPAIFRHLKKYQEALEARWDKGNHWWELRPCAYYDDFEKPKIIYPDIAIVPRFCLDEDGYFAEATTFIVPKGDKYLLSLLNSRLCYKFIRSLAPTIGDQDERGRTRFKSIYMEQLPIRRINFTTPESERKRLAKDLINKYNAGEFGKILAGTGALLPRKGDEKSDVVHDMLSFLAEEMQKMNREKQEETRGFLRFLERETGASIDSFSGKTKLYDYYEYDFDSLLDILNKNRNRLTGFDTHSRRDQERLLKEFDKSLKILKPLMEKIRETDALIDQIVYRLYGLTEEEIGIVSPGAY